MIYITDTHPEASAACVPDQYVSETILSIVETILEAIKQTDNELYDELSLPHYKPNLLKIDKKICEDMKQNPHIFDYLLSYAIILAPNNIINQKSNCISTLSTLVDNSYVIASIFKGQQPPLTFPSAKLIEEHRKILHQKISMRNQSCFTWSNNAPPLWLIKQFYVLSTAELTPQYLYLDGSMSTEALSEKMMRFTSAHNALSFAKERTTTIKNEEYTRKALGPRAANANNEFSKEIRQ